MKQTVTIIMTCLHLLKNYTKCFWKYLFYSKSIPENDSKRSYKIVGCSNWIVLIITLNVFTTNEFPLIVPQVVFSSSYILGMINLILYYYRLKSLYDDFYKCLITEKTCSDITIIHLVGLCVEYEIIKGSQQIKISSKLFKELNPKLSANWDKLKTKCIYYHN